MEASRHRFVCWRGKRLRVSCIMAPRTLMGQPTLTVLLGGAAKVYITLLNLTRSSFLHQDSRSVYQVCCGGHV